MARDTEGKAMSGKARREQEKSHALGDLVKEGRGKGCLQVASLLQSSRAAISSLAIGQSTEIPGFMISLGLHHGSGPNKYMWKERSGGRGEREAWRNARKDRKVGSRKEERKFLFPEALPANLSSLVHVHEMLRNFFQPSEVAGL